MTPLWKNPIAATDNDVDPADIADDSAEPEDSPVVDQDGDGVPLEEDLMIPIRPSSRVRSIFPTTVSIKIVTIKTSMLRNSSAIQRSIPLQMDVPPTGCSWEAPIRGKEMEPRSEMEGKIPVLCSLLEPLEVER